MEAIILAGGFGTRLRRAVPDVPKPMAPVRGRPFLELLLASLRARGVTRAVLSIGYMADTIRSYFQAREVGLDLAYEIESEPLGTGGGIAAALRRVQGDHALVLNGDTYVDLDLGALEALWPGDRSVIVVTRHVDDTSRYGRIEVDNGRIAKFAGTAIQGPGLINAGCYVVPRELFAEHDRRAFSFEQDFLVRSPPRSLRAFSCSGQFIDIGVPEDYLRAQAELADLRLRVDPV
jgi:D-glycero-alpha-D-manno-heptose 1-phosphate guanylyltransferase